MPTEFLKVIPHVPDHLRIIAGDFNENLDGKTWYGVKDAKEANQFCVVQRISVPVSKIFGFTICAILGIVASPGGNVLR